VEARGILEKKKMWQMTFFFPIDHVPVCNAGYIALPRRGVVTNMVYQATSSLTLRLRVQFLLLNLFILLIGQYAPTCTHFTHHLSTLCFST
jgi:hypothetical protein